MARPRFLADEDIRGAIIAAAYRTMPALEITSVVEQGWASATDDEILELAWRHDWLIMSHDVNTMRNFAEQRLQRGAHIHGLFLASQSRPTKEIADCLELIWEASEFEEWHDRIVYLPF